MTRKPKAPVPTGKYDDIAGAPERTPAAEAPELDAVARASIADRPRRRERASKRHGRLAEPGVAQLNVAMSGDLRLRLKRHCEDVTIAAQARDPLAPPVTMSGVIERLVCDYLERVKG